MDLRTHLTWIRIGIGLVWLVFGLGFKALNLVPRHRRIIARVVGDHNARTVTNGVVFGECLLGVWMISGIYLVPCVAIQTIAIVTMNILEIRRARDLLWSPYAMVCANLVLLGLAWYVAFAS